MNEQLPQFTHHIVDCSQSIEGIVAIAVGGSRARSNHTAKSDVDLGLYYQLENPPDLLALNRFASELDNSHRTNLITPIVTEHIILRNLQVTYAFS
jgi:predicted nucleotidyltransferase